MLSIYLSLKGKNFRREKVPNLAYSRLGIYIILSSPASGSFLLESYVVILNLLCMSLVTVNCLKHMQEVES